MSELNVKFGNDQKSIPGPATVLDAIKAFDRDVLKKSLAAKVNGVEVDLNRELDNTDEVLSIEPITVGGPSTTFNAIDTSPWFRLVITGVICALRQPRFQYSTRARSRSRSSSAWFSLTCL